MEPAKRSVQARFGGLGERFGVLIPAGRSLRRRLRLSLAQQTLLEQVFLHYREAGSWPSIGQEILARELGIGRSTLSSQLGTLRASGLIATREDPRYGTTSKTLRYCLDPYLALVALLEAGGADRAQDQLREEGGARLSSFTASVRDGDWHWRVGAIEAPPSSAGIVLHAFAALHGLPERFLVAPGLLRGCEDNDGQVGLFDMQVLKGSTQVEGYERQLSTDSSKTEIDIVLAEPTLGLTE